MTYNQIRAKELFETMKALEKDGAVIISFAETDKKGESFKDLAYFTFIKDGKVFYLQGATFSGFTICHRLQVNNYQTIQCDYADDIPETIEAVNDYIKKAKAYKKPLSGVYNQHLWLLEFNNGDPVQYIKKNVCIGNREKAILDNLDKIVMTQNDGDIKAFHFIAKDGNFFEYEANRKSITG